MEKVELALACFHSLVVQNILQSQPVQDHLKQRGPKATVYQVYTFSSSSHEKMSTISRQESIDCAKLVHSFGSNFIGMLFDINTNSTESPVLGSNTVAAAGKLQMLIAGNKSLVEQHHDALTKLGTTRFVSDEIGKSSSLKLALNQLVCQTVASFAVSLAMVEKEG